MAHDVRGEMCAAEAKLAGREGNASPDAEIVGRDEELHGLSAFLEPGAAPGALLIEGAAGIGKTTLWRYGVERAAERGWRVLTAGPAPSEARLAFAAIGDLLVGVVDAAVSRLPPPQRRALEVALLLDDVRGPPPDERTVAVAVLGALRVLGRERPLLVAVDDVQWLDSPSAEVLSFVARRLTGDPVALLLVQRTDEARGVPLGLDRAFGQRLLRVRPRPLSLGATHRLLGSHLGLTLTRPALRRVHSASRGNPLFALEIGRILQERPDVLRADEPLPVPHDVEQLVGRRIERLSEPGRAAVLAAALHGEPSIAVVEEAADEAGLEEAVAAGVLVADGDALTFAHPLFAEAAIFLTPASRRREMHLRLAALLEDPEAHAQHLALGTSEPATDVAAALDLAAEAARRRGAPASAADLAEHATRLTPERAVDAAARRTIAAAQWWIDAGDTRRSLALVEPLLARLPAGPLRLEALSAKARAVEDRGVQRRLLEDAVAGADGYPNHQVRLLLQLCYALSHAQEFDAARERARVAVEIAERTGDTTLVVLALSMAGRLNVGIGGLELLRRARELEPPAGAVDAYEDPATWLGWWLLANDELDAARRLLADQQQRAIDDGDEWNRTVLYWPLTEVECRAGNYEAARAYAEEGAELAEQSDSLYALWQSTYCRALVAAHVGDGATARAHAEDSLRTARAVHSELFAARPQIVLGFLAVSEGRYEDALHHLAGLPELALSGPYSVTYPFWGDLFEALVSLGKLEHAQSLLANLERHRLATERPGTGPVLARGRGLVLAASGSLDEAVASLEEALRLRQARPAPLERARTLLALGEVQRRAKQRRAARETLNEALEGFESLGAQLWVERARKEIARIGGRSPSGGDLTVSERRLAELVAEGRSNKEAAAALFVTAKTVETKLSRIYAKLGIHSRAELARRLAASKL
jgi:DNA-binding CsgD family transcriptional regulator